MDKSLLQYMEITEEELIKRLSVEIKCEICNITLKKGHYNAHSKQILHIRKANPTIEYKKYLRKRDSHWKEMWKN
tara:strand:+ start:386 stop:610 length:225 start_codon:yes stop_codon:yes gene_type:complete